MTEQPRVTIVYPAGHGATFDFGYYVPRHLPLAVGTSLRHAAITYCDADRTIGADAPHVCLCVVGFESIAAMNDFRHFFASGHPDTRRILADEPNYTNIRPLFVAGMVRSHASVRGRRPAPVIVYVSCFRQRRGRDLTTRDLPGCRRHCSGSICDPIAH